MELYLKGCQIRHEEPIYNFAFEDLDKIYEKSQNCKECFLKPGYLIEYKDFLYKDKLLADHDNRIIVYYNIEKIIDLINSMQDNNIKSLNRWKLKEMEKVIILGWEKYCNNYIDSCLHSQKMFF